MAVAVVGVPMVVLGEDSDAITPWSTVTATPDDAAADPSTDDASGSSADDAVDGTATATPSITEDTGDSRTPTAADAASPSGEAAPQGDLPGWSQIFVDDFDESVEQGGFPGPYSDSWLAYDGFTDTADVGTYRASAVSAADGVLSLGVSTHGDEVTSSAVVPLVDGLWGGQTYGRYSVRLRADPVPGYSAAFLLWSDDNDWNDGEVDFPEGHLDKNVRAYNHTPGNPSENSFARRTAVPFTDWHTYTIDWTPDEIAFSIDGVTIGTTSHDIPTAKLHWVMQIETTKTTPPDGAEGAVQVDWATIYRYEG